MTRLRCAILIIVAGPVVPSYTAGAQSGEETAPNIIVFVADDLGWRDIGVYGNRAIRTPNIDRLAGAGLRVDRAFGTSPQCSPSRISMLTGMYPARLELYDVLADPWEVRKPGGGPSLCPRAAGASHGTAEMDGTDG